MKTTRTPSEVKSQELEEEKKKLSTNQLAKPGKTIARGIAEAHCYSNAMNIL